MNFSEKLKNIKAENEANKIKLEPNKPYNAVIKMVSETINDKNKTIWQMILNITDDGMNNKIVKKSFYIDESYTEQVRNIAFSELSRIFEMCEIEIPSTLETQDDFLLLCSKLKNKNVVIELRKVADKKDPTKVFNNYYFYKNIDEYNKWKK